MKNLKRYKSFTLIELIISIIVIGIIAVTLPLMLQSTSETLKTSAKEEVFYQEFSLLQLIDTLYFDENNTNGENYYKDLNATKGDTELLIYRYSSDELNRIGKHQMNNNIFRSGSNSTVSHIGVDEGEDSEDKYDDIDDYNGFNETLLSYGNVLLKVRVKYIDDESEYNKSKINFEFNYKDEKNSTNIKLIQISTTVDNKKIILNYPAMNIGRSKYLSLEEISQ